MAEFKGEVDPKMMPPWYNAAKQLNVPDEVIQAVFDAGFQQGATSVVSNVLAAIGMHPSQQPKKQEGVIVDPYREP